MGTIVGLTDGTQSRASGWGRYAGASPSLLCSFGWWARGPWEELTG